MIILFHYSISSHYYLISNFQTDAEISLNSQNLLNSNKLGTNVLTRINCVRIPPVYLNGYLYNVKGKMSL